MQPARSGIPDDGEKVAPDPAAGRFHQPQRRVRRDRGVDGAATPLEDVHRHLRRERLAGGGHPVPRQDHRSGREGAPGDPVEAAEPRRKDRGEGEGDEQGLEHAKVLPTGSGRR